MKSRLRLDSKAECTSLAKLIWFLLTFALLAGCGDPVADTLVEKGVVYSAGSVVGRPTSRRMIGEVGLDSAAEVQSCLSLCQQLPDLRILRISGVKLSPQDLERIGAMRGLVYLTLANCHLSDGDLRSIASQTELRKLSLGKNDITDAGLIHLSELKDLHTLDLRWTKVQGLGFVHLRPCSQLSVVWMDDTPLDDAGVELFAIFPKLKNVSYSNTHVTELGLYRLAAANPQLMERPPFFPMGRSKFNELRSNYDGL